MTIGHEHMECWHTQFHKAPLDIKAQTDPKTIIVCDFTILLSQIDRSHRPINKETSELNDTINHMNLVYRLFHPTAVECTFFSAAHETSSKIDHILGCKASLNKY
jgi:hypothetical protein